METAELRCEKIKLPFKLLDKARKLGVTDIKRFFKFDTNL